MEKEDAVSPVIATILMVAITVVLAATVYILVSHYTSVGAATPLTATISETSEGGGYVIFSTALSTPSNISHANDIHLTASGANLTSPTSLTYTAGKNATSPDYWIGAIGSTGYSIVVTFTDPNGLAANAELSANYVSSSASMNVYIIKTPSSGTTPTITSAGVVSGFASSWTMSGITVAMTVSGYSGTVTATAP